MFFFISKYHLCICLLTYSRAYFDQSMFYELFFPKNTFYNETGVILEVYAYFFMLRVRKGPSLIFRYFWAKFLVV